MCEHLLFLKVMVLTGEATWNQKVLRVDPQEWLSTPLGNPGEDSQRFCHGKTVKRPQIRINGPSSLEGGSDPSQRNRDEPGNWHNQLSVTWTLVCTGPGAE